MATLSNSSIREWLQFDGSAGPQIYPCQLVTDPVEFLINTTTRVDIKPAPCSHVCNNSLSLFWPFAGDRPNRNLVTCGLWTVIMSSLTHMDHNNTLQYSAIDKVAKYTALFAEVGLTEDDNLYLPSYVDTISNCLELIYINVKAFSYSDDQKSPEACNGNLLFSNDLTKAKFTPDLRPARDCLDATCAPLTLNPDLAGIGVSF